MMCILMLLPNFESLSAEQNGLSSAVSDLFPGDTSFEPLPEGQITRSFCLLCSVPRYFFQYRTIASGESGTIKVINLPRRKQIIRRASRK